jgi:heat shock protein HslJ
MRVARSPLLCVLMGVTLAGCAMFSSTTPTHVKPIIPKPIENSSQTFPLDRTLVAVSYKDQKFKDDRPTMLVSANYRGTGFSACNNWSATIVPRPSKQIAIGPVAISKRVCDQRLMHNEQVFLFVLRTTQSWAFDGRVLTLSGPYGTMTFEPAI